MLLKLHEKTRMLFAQDDLNAAGLETGCSCFQARGPALPIGHAPIVVTISLYVKMCTVTFGFVTWGGSYSIITKMHQDDF